MTDDDRRRVLKVLAGASLVPLLGCGAADAAAACAPIRAETPGPFPGDGSNGPNALAMPGVVRADLRSSFGGLTGTAGGVPLAVRFTVVDGACAPLAGRAIYLWACDREGRYSLYSAGVTDQNYQRGVQATDANGVATFMTVFPGCYPGRWPHFHFEIYDHVASAVAARPGLRVSQLALPAATCAAVYRTEGYAASRAAIAPLRVETDGVFRDGFEDQLATVTGDLTAGLTASLTVTV
jgi:protocatechuate 3,4-dioxygenase beta subunit